VVFAGKGVGCAFEVDTCVRAFGLGNGVRGDALATIACDSVVPILCIALWSYLVFVKNHLALNIRCLDRLNIDLRDRFPAS
jgi:hypothetical protein